VSSSLGLDSVFVIVGLIQKLFIKLQPKFMAVFGDTAGDIFRELFEARDMVRFAAQELTWKIPVVPVVRSNEDFEMRMRLRADLWEGFAGYEDRVEAKLRNFRANIERKCRPVIDREFRASMP
jgi:hypothetical protein